jgi:hypothetical protein
MTSANGFNDVDSELSQGLGYKSYGIVAGFEAELAKEE